MRNFIATALMASIAFTKQLEENFKVEAKTLTAKASKWPVSSSRGHSDQAQLPARAICRMQYNPEYPTTFPHGEVKLLQYDPWSPVFIYGYMAQLPRS